MDFVQSLISNDVYRIVESQSYSSTRQLVDSSEEHAILEELLDNNKPKYLEKYKNLHYLLTTPFRYPPLKYGSRFGDKTQRGIFYGSLDINTAICEAAYYRFIFLYDSKGKMRPSFIPYFSFSIEVKSNKMLDLTKNSFKENRKEISNPNSYVYSQKIGSMAREKDFEVISYYSARKEKELNMAIFTPKVFGNRKIKNQQSWNMYVDYKNITFSKDREREFINFSEIDFYYNKEFPIISN